MNTRKQKNLERLIFKTFEKEIEGTDIYNNNGSMWVIFTDEKKWVVEYTKERTLWYNYSLFNSIMMLFGVDNNETAEYVKMWFENRFLFKPKIKETTSDNNFLISAVEDDIQNGVKHISGGRNYGPYSVEETIQNGVKDITYRRFVTVDVEDTIQNGVKRTEGIQRKDSPMVEDAIQNGVKRMYTSGESKLGVEDTIQNGVKHTNCKFQFTLQGINDAIENGANDTDPETYQINSMVEDTIQNGVKS